MYTPTILVIDDNEEMADNIASILELANYNVKQAHNGKVGIELAQQFHPDLILCDIMMPELDGYGVLHLLNKDPKTSLIPFIFLTAKADKSDFRIGMSLGADDYVVKPFESLDLLKTIETRLKKKEILKSSFDNNQEDIFKIFEKKEASSERRTEDHIKKKFKKKEIIFLEGEIPTEVYLIRQGEVKTFKVNPDGKEFITGIHRGGEFIGHVSLLKEGPYHESAEALTNCEIVIIPKQEFLTTIFSNKEAATKIIKLLTQHIIEAETKLLDIAYQSVRQRVANALLAINAYNSATTKKFVSMARKDMSNMIGTATESLNRTLADFKDEGLIDIQTEGIKILDTNRLMQLLH